MSEKKIYYAIIALTKDNVEKIIPKLKKEGKNTIATWLEDNGNNIYGNIPEDWKPFHNETIINIVETNATDYKSETQLISNLNEECTNVGSLSCIKIYFIDMFAMYMQKYIEFAKRIDFALLKASSHCCFLINYSLPIDVQNDLEKTYKKNWPTVSKSYEDGSLHRIAVRIDDVKNFKNYLRDLLAEDNPNPSNYKKLSEMFPPDRDIPKLGGPK